MDGSEKRHPVANVSKAAPDFAPPHQNQGGSLTGIRPSSPPSCQEFLRWQNPPSASACVRRSRAKRRTGARLVFRMTGENKSNTEPAVPIHLSPPPAPPRPPRTRLTVCNRPPQLHHCEFDAGSYLEGTIPALLLYLGNACLIKPQTSSSFP